MFLFSTHQKYRLSLPYKREGRVRKLPLSLSLREMCTSSKSFFFCKEKKTWFTDMPCLHNMLQILCNIYIFLIKKKNTNYVAYTNPVWARLCEQRNFCIDIYSAQKCINSSILRENENIRSRCDKKCFKNKKQKRAYWQKKVCFQKKKQKIMVI